MFIFNDDIFVKLLFKIQIIQIITMLQSVHSK